MTSRRGMWSSGSAAKMKNEILFFFENRKNIFKNNQRRSRAL